MRETGFQRVMMDQLAGKELFEQAKAYAYAYMDGLGEADVYPSAQTVEGLRAFDGALPEGPCAPSDLLRLLNERGSGATVAQSGGRYFGFVCGGVLPVCLAAKWMADAWDQNGAVFVQSPVTAKLETVCERWLAELFRLPQETAAGLVSGSSTAILCAVAAARNALLRKQGWDVGERGLFGAPPLRVVVGEQAHSSVWKALALTGLGKANVTTAPVDDQGRILPDRLPALDEHTLLVLQAGNVNSGAFDPVDALCDAARKAGTWVHIDGAFGLWAAASPKRRGLIRGLEKADSWSTDAHKTLNVPYDCGIVLCRERGALVDAMRASGAYLQFSDERDGMLYTPEMSRRARSVELWAALKYLGRSGTGELVDTLCDNAAYFAEALTKNGFAVVNDVVFNQVLFRCDTPERTKRTLRNIQSSGRCWCGGSVWRGEPVVRVSVCSWQTTRQDIDDCVATFAACRERA